MMLMLMLMLMAMLILVVVKPAARLVIQAEWLAIATHWQMALSLPLVMPTLTRCALKAVSRLMK
eukprot:5960827-Pleurochrysis_carterae.AAC.1